MTPNTMGKILIAGGLLLLVISMLLGITLGEPNENWLPFLGSICVVVVIASGYGISKRDKWP